MKTLLEKIKKLNSRKNKKGSALVTVIYITSIALVLVMSIFSLANYSLNTAISDVKEDQAIINAQSIAKMISDELTSDNKTAYKEALEPLKPHADGSFNATEVTYNLNNEELGDTKVVFKNEENRLNNVIMTVKTNYKGETGVVKVRFKITPEGEENKAVLQEVQKIFDNTVYSGAFPTGLIRSLNFVDFAGDIVIKLDQAKDVGSNNNGIFFGGKDHLVTRKRHNGNLIVIFNDPTKTLYLGGGAEIHGNVITDGKIQMDYMSKITGSIIAKNDIVIGDGGSAFETIGTDLAQDGYAILTGGKLTLNINTGGGLGLGLIMGNIYAQKGVSNLNTLAVKGKIYIDEGEVTSNENISFYENKTLFDKYSVSEAIENKKIIKNFKFGDQDNQRTIAEEVDRIMEDFYSDTPNPIWYAPDDWDEKRNDTQSDSPKETWHNFYGSYKDEDGKQIAYSDIMKKKYNGINLKNPVNVLPEKYADGSIPTTKGNLYSWTDKNGNEHTRVAMINSSGYINQNIVNKATNEVAQGQSEKALLLSDYQKTVILDTRAKDLHIKLTENITFDNTDVVVIGNNYVYFYTEQYTINVGNNKTVYDNFVAYEIDSYIHFGVKAVKNKNSYTRKYNAEITSEGFLWNQHYEYESSLKVKRPQVFVISSYGEKQLKGMYDKEVDAHKADSNVPITIQMVKKENGKQIFPFLCVNKNAAAYTYLFAPYRPVLFSESYYKYTAYNKSYQFQAANPLNNGMYKFMGSLCVNRIDDYKDPSTQEYGGQAEFAYGVGLFRHNMSTPYRKMFYFDPTKSKGAFDGIIFNRESIPADETGGIIQPPEGTPADPVKGAWTIEAFL